MKKFKLDLACGNHKKKGFIGVDIIKKGTQANIQHDLLKFPWPWKDNSVDEIYCSHFLEHLPHIDSYDDYLFKFMNELWRITKPGGSASFLCPYYTSVRAFQDPTHHRFINEATFLYFDKNWRKVNELEHYPIHCDFKIIKVNLAISQEFVGRSPEVIQSQSKHSWNVADDIMVTLQKPFELKSKKR